MTGDELNCLYCNKKFIKKNPWHRSCSKNCNQNVKRKSERTKYCDFCEERFLDESSNNRRKSCSQKCRKLMNRANKYKLEPGALRYLLQSPCFICGDEIEDSKKRHIDHCHESGEPRGILCHNCNIGLGMFHDDPIRLEKASKYIRENY